VWRLYPVGVCYDTRWLMGLWFTQAKVVCRGLHGTGVGGSSVINDPLGEPGRTPLYVGLPSVWVSVDGDLMFFPIL